MSRIPEVLGMKRLTALMAVALFAIALIAGCSQRSGSTVQGTPSPQQESATPSSTEESVSGVDQQLDEIDDLDKDLDSSELDSLDRDLADI